MKKINKEKIRTYALAIVLSLLIVSVGFTVAYFSASITGDGTSNVTVNTENVPVLEFATSGSLSVAAGMYNFSEGDGNVVSDTVTSTATLTTDSAYTTEYFVYLNITENEFVYTQDSSTPELILTIKDENGDLITSIENLEYVTVGDVTGFDITEASGVYEIVNNYEISTTSDEPVVHTWTYKLTFINLDADQNDNAGKSLSAEIVMDDTGYVYVPTLSEAILMNEVDEDGNNFTSVTDATTYITSKGEPVWGTASSTDDGLYAINDEYGVSYYFRGAVDDNWVIFGTDENDNDMYWRIVRINGDGSVRMVYTGTTAPNSTTSVVMTGEETLAGETMFNSKYNSAEYVGYMYTLDQAHGNSESSTIKLTLEEWYEANLLDETNQIADAYFCYDRTTATSGYQYSSYGYSSTTGYSTTQTGTTGTLFAAAGRNTVSSIAYKASTTSPSLMCSNTNDQYTASDTTYGNGELEYSIGLLTFDEAVLAGYAAGSSNATTNNYLYRGSYYIWLGSPFGFGTAYLNAIVSNLNSSSYVSYNGVGTSYYLLPAVSLSSSILVEGDGTYESPYRVVES